MTNPPGSVFLDASAGEPLLLEAREAWLAAQDAGWADPLALHRAGRRAAQALDQTRAVVADAVGARPDEVVFTASGPHSAHAAIAGLALGRRRVGSTLVTTAVEHSSVLDASAAAGDPMRLPVDAHGRVALDAWEAAVGADGVALAALQVGNHEVGTLQPYAEAAEISSRAGVPLVLDATSALGRVDLRQAGPWAALIGSAVAFGGPPSVGFLVLKHHARWRAPYPTDDYQGRRWPGRPDLPAIFAAAVALETWLSDADAVGAQQRRLVDGLRRGLAQAIPDLDVVGDPDGRLPHLLTFSALYVDGETLTLELDRAGFAVASGSACSADHEHPSHVLAAMGALTHGNVRIGLTRTTTQADVEAFLAALPPIVERVRATLGAP